MQKVKSDNIKCLMLIFVLLNATLFAQTNAHLPLKSFTFDYVSVNVKESVDSSFIETGQFIGNGEIYIYNDSITIAWSNQWECGNYRLFIDSAKYQTYEYDKRLEWLSIYSVRSKGYHQVDGLLTLIEGSDLDEGSYIDIIFDTNFTADGWARKRRMYLNIKVLK